MLAGGVIALLVLPLAVAFPAAAAPPAQRRPGAPAPGRRGAATARPAGRSGGGAPRDPGAAGRAAPALVRRHRGRRRSRPRVRPRSASPARDARHGRPARRWAAALGRLRLEADPDRDPFGPGDRRLLEDVGAEVGALVQAVLISSELQRSRQRLITAREEERRRLRRDLHDGLGPSLATMAMQLEAARDLIAEDPDPAAELVERLSDRARNDIAEIRRLVDGLRPPALDQLGLVSALRQRAEEHGFGAPRLGAAALDGDRRRRRRAVAGGGRGRGVPDRGGGREQRPAAQRRARRCEVGSHVRTACCRTGPRRRRGAGRQPRSGCRPDLDEGAG